MAIERAAVERAARLARIALSLTELDELTKELSSTLSQLEPLRALPAANPTQAIAAGPPGSDEPGADPLHEPPSYLAPQWHGGYYTVPRVIPHARDE